MFMTIENSGQHNKHVMSTFYESVSAMKRLQGAIFLATVNYILKNKQTLQLCIVQQFQMHLLQSNTEYL